jgi:hypothetical protein
MSMENPRLLSGGSLIVTLRLSSVSGATAVESSSNATAGRGHGTVTGGVALAFDSKIEGGQSALFNGLGTEETEAISMEETEGVCTEEAEESRDASEPFLIATGGQGIDAGAGTGAAGIGTIAGLTGSSQSDWSGSGGVLCGVAFIEADPRVLASSCSD